MTEALSQTAWERALATDASFIVQAPAGSGKTELLIRRFLCLLAVVEEPEEVVAITFTKKAAAEMRERVVQAIRQVSLPPNSSQHDQALWQIAQRARANNQRRNWQLERHPARLRIQTIDALCAAITRQMPWLSGFGAPLQVVEDATALYRTAAADTMRLLASDKEEWRTAASVLLQHLDNQLYRAVRLLTDMLRYRDQWLRHLGRGMVQGQEQERAALQAAWSDAVHEELSRIAGAVADDFKPELTACAAYAAEQLRQTRPDSSITAWYGSRSFATAAVEDLPRWRGLSELLLTANGHWRRRLDVNIGFPTGKSKTQLRMKSRMQALLDALSTNEAIRQALLKARRLPDVVFTDQQWHVLSALTRLLSLAAARLNLLFGETGQVDFSEINMRANQALGSLDSPSELALRLDSQISHLLVDEFQDTSLTQYELIKNLTAGWVKGDGHTLFLVGDPMQSIYRFREAEVGLFMRVQRHGLGGLRPEPLTLKVNFRSDPKLVSWANATFAACFPGTADLARGAMTFTQSDAALPTRAGAGVKFHPLYDEDEDAEAQHIVRLVQQTWKSNPQEQIAVLVRARSTLRQILPALDEAGISYAGIDIQQLTWQPVIQDLLSITAALSSPADRMAWLSMLRAPWCGLTLDDLSQLASHADHLCIWDCLRKEDVVASLSASGQRRLRRFIEPVARAMQNRGRVSTRRCVENVWIELGGPACIGEHERDNVRIFLHLLDHYERRYGIEDFSGFSQVVAEHWAQPGSRTDQRLQLMTLHKAKGLEFDTVIIPALHRQLRRDDARLLLWEEQMDALQASLLLAPLAQAGPYRDPHYDYLRALHAEKEHFETLRLLYVGCTRARRCVHLSGLIKTGERGEIVKPREQSLMAKLWPRLGAALAQSEVKQFELFTTRSAKRGALRLRRLPLDWCNTMPDSVEFAVADADAEVPAEDVEFSWVGETARHVGVLVHRMLERIARDGAASWDAQRLSDLQPAWCRQLAHWGVPADKLNSATDRVFTTLSNVLQDERALWILSSEHRDAANELALSSAHSGHVRNVRIDRTFIDARGTRWIIDFKSGAHEGAQLDDFLDREQQRYREQLENYAQAFASLEQRAIRLGLYFPLLRGWREWEYLRPMRDA